MRLQYMTDGDFIGSRVDLQLGFRLNIAKREGIAYFVRVECSRVLMQLDLKVLWPGAIDDIEALKS